MILESFRQGNMDNRDVIALKKDPDASIACAAVSRELALRVKPFARPRSWQEQYWKQKNLC